MTKYERLQDLFNAHHNWSSPNPRAIQLSAEQIIETLETSEQGRLMELPEHKQSDSEWMGERILGNAVAHLRGQEPFFQGGSVAYWQEACQ